MVWGTPHHREGSAPLTARQRDGLGNSPPSRRPRGHEHLRQLGERAADEPHAHHCEGERRVHHHRDERVQKYTTTGVVTIRTDINYRFPSRYLHLYALHRRELELHRLPEVRRLLQLGRQHQPLTLRTQEQALFEDVLRHNFIKNVAGATSVRYELLFPECRGLSSSRRVCRSTFESGS